MPVWLWCPLNRIFPLFTGECIDNLFSSLFKVNCFFVGGGVKRCRGDYFSGVYLNGLVRITHYLKFLSMDV